MTLKYSIKRQITCDYSTFISLCGFIVISIILIGIRLFGITFTKRAELIEVDDEMKFIYTIIFGTIIFLCIIFFIYRIIKGRYFVKNGIEIDAEISNVLYYEDRGSVYYTYEYNNKKYKYANGIHITKITRNYKKEDKIKILLDPKNIKKAVIRNHFVNL